jgi:Domain of unknown function (DUF4166)
MGKAAQLGIAQELLSDDALGDLRFRALLGPAQWDDLPQAVRARFSKRYGAGRSVSYTGTIAACRMSRLGWLLAQACRLIGAPLPLDRGGGAAAVVTVTEHAPSGGQVWTRVYARRGGFPQVIHSAKMFSGGTGLEEYIGLGIGIALRVQGSAEGIAFHSDHYFMKLGGRRLRLPRWLTPGALRIDHLDRGGGTFCFVLDLRHPLLGELIHQVGDFADQPVLAAG